MNYPTPARSARTRFRSSWHLGFATTSVVALSVALAACGSANTVRAGTAHRATQGARVGALGVATDSGSGPSGGEAFHLGPDYGSVQVMAADLQQDGVWVWASEYPTKTMDEAQSQVFHYAKKGGLQSWPLGHDRSVLAGPIAEPSLAACGTNAWLGINWRLFELNPVKGIVGRGTFPRSHRIKR